MMLNTVQDNPDTELNRTMAIAMFEVTLNYYNLFTRKGDKKFIQACYDKAKGPKMITDLRSMLLNLRNLLDRHPCADRSGCADRHGCEDISVCP